MIIILDPALFLTQEPGSLLPDEEEELIRLVNEAARIYRKKSGLLPNVKPYWTKLQRELLRPLEQLERPKLNRGLDELRQYARPLKPLDDLEGSRFIMWGVKQLFKWPRLEREWFELMERLLLWCALLGEDVLLVTRLFEGRNQKTSSTGGCILEEKTRWRVYVELIGHPSPRVIPCVQSMRNLEVEWTTRFDKRLPVASDGARYPFCPPDNWWRGNTKAWRTVKSKPAWIDKQGNAWVRPSTGGGYHWDVYIKDQNLAQRIGLDQLNIVQWGAPESEGPAGHIHHVPGNKASRLKDDTGWTCD